MAAEPADALLQPKMVPLSVTLPVPVNQIPLLLFDEPVILELVPVAVIVLLPIKTP